MDFTRAKITVANASDPSKAAEVEVVVDTDSAYTWIPRSTLEGLEIAPRGEKRFRTIDGGQVARRVGPAVVIIQGHEVTTDVVFAEAGDAAVLGVADMERLGFRVNPVTRELEYVGLLALGNLRV